MKLSLVVLSEGKASGQAIPIKLPQFLIGRDPQCHLRPTSAVISKRHCALITKNGHVYIRDFDSTNGTFVNEGQVKGQRELKDGDVLKLGPITLRIQLEGAVAVDKPTPLPANRHEAGEEDAAALLLTTDDGTVGTMESVSEGDIPTGTTVMDLNAMALQAESESVGAKGADKKDAKGKVDTPNTASAAAAILAKYSRRQRS